MSTTIVGLYRTEADVRRVTDELSNHGFDRQEINRHDDSETDLRGWLVEHGVPDHEAEEYVAGVSHGGMLVTLDAEDDRAEEALAIMQRHEQAVAGAAGVGEAATTDARDANRTHPRNDARTNRVGNDDSPKDRVDAEGEETIEVVEEELEVGTREVDRGDVSVRRYATERPVEEQVRVRDETVNVDRRPVDRPVEHGDVDSAFQERTVAMTETDQEVVVGKRARVVEEVVLSKDVDERTETVRDTVRKTDVEIERADDVLDTERDDFLTHHRDTLGGTEEDYPDREPAYRYGAELANHPDHRGRTWSEVAPAAREQWIGQNGETWAEYEPAVRYSFERSAERGQR